MTNAPGQRTEGVAVSQYVPGGHDHGTAAPRQNIAAQLRRRRLASLRCEPLTDGRRDPLQPIRDTGPAEVGDLEAWMRALEYLRAAGLVGLPPAHVRRSLAALPERYGHVE